MFRFSLISLTASAKQSHAFHVLTYLRLVFQVLDKYGDIYGRERIAELLGMDLASLDVSAMTHEKKPEPDTSMFSWSVQDGPFTA